MKKSFAAVSLAAIASSVFAQTGMTPQTARFAERKAQMVAHIQERIAKEQAVMACVQSAQNHEALKACKPAHRG